MRIRILLGIMACLAASTAFADTITLRSGQFVQGSYLGGDARTVRVAVGDHVQTFKVEEIAGITFDASQAPAPQPAAAPSPQPTPAPPPPGGPELPAGTPFTIRMIDSVDSERDSIGKTYRASLDEPIVDRNGTPLISKGADAVVKLIDDKQAGKLEGRTVLTLNLASVRLDGRSVDINTTNVTEKSASQTAKTAKVVGGTAVVGAVIGAIAGGGKGAAIGAGAGAGTGAVVELATKGQKVKVPSETRLTFALQQPVRL